MTESRTPGDRLPDVQLTLWRKGKSRPVSTAEHFAGRRVALFAVPGAFTPACSDTHLPGFLVRADDLKAQGVDEIVCTAVNDVFVLAAWAEATAAADHIAMLADGSGDLARAMGLVLDGTGFGMGLRSRRYAAVVEDGVITYLGVEPGREVGVSGAEAVLRFLAETAD